MSKPTDEMVTLQNKMGFYTAQQLAKELGIAESTVHGTQLDDRHVSRVGKFKFFHRETVKRAYHREPVTTVKVLATPSKDLTTVMDLQLEMMSKLHDQIAALKGEIQRLSARLDRDESTRLAEIEAHEEREAREGNGANGRRGAPAF